MLLCFQFSVPLRWRLIHVCVCVHRGHRLQSQNSVSAWQTRQATDMGKKLLNSCASLVEAASIIDTTYDRYRHLQRCIMPGDLSNMWLYFITFIKKSGMVKNNAHKTKRYRPLSSTYEKTQWNVQSEKILSKLNTYLPPVSIPPRWVEKGPFYPTKMTEI